MISKECKITVSGNTASIDSEIYLYKNDMNIKYLFNIVNGDYAYTKDSNLDNIINANKASYAQIKFKKEDIEIDFDVQETSNGKVILLIKKELIDEDTELGDYTIQIRLFDESKTSVITLPPVNNCIHIMRPIFEKVDGSTNVVDEAAVDEAIVTYSEPMEAIASDGTFAKKTWVAKEKITTAELNRMEEGIAYNNSQYKDIANLSLALGKDGLLYIKKQDGTLIGTGVKVNNDTDLSKVTMQINGNTLILLNNGTQIASVDLPNNMSATDVSNLIKKGVSETNYNALDTTDKRIIGGINEINIHLNSTAKKTIVEGNKIYLAKSDGTKLDTGTILPTGGTGKPYDDTSIKSDISNIKNDLGTAQLTTTAQNVKGAINEIDAKCDDIAVKTITTEERTKLTNLKNYDDTSIKADINNIKADLGTAELNTTAKDLKGAVNEINAQYKDIANLSLTKHTDGKVYIKKQDGTLMGTGIEIGGSDVDLSKITMSMSGQTLKLMNDGTQIASVEIPTATVTDEQLTTIIQSKIDDGTLSALTIEDGSIGNIKLSAIGQQRINLLNINTSTSGKKINKFNYIGDNADYDLSDYIEIELNTLYYVIGADTRSIQYCLYDNSKKFVIGGEFTFVKNNDNGDNIRNTTLTVENAKYIRFSYLTANKDRVIFCKDKIRDYVPYDTVETYLTAEGESLRDTLNKDYKVTTNNINNNTITPTMTNFCFSDDLNLVDCDNYMECENSVMKLYYSNYFMVNNGETLYTNKGFNFIYFYNKYKNFLSKIGGATNSTGALNQTEVTINQENVYYARIVYPLSYFTDKKIMVTRYKGEQNTYKEFATKWFELKDDYKEYFIKNVLSVPYFGETIKDILLPYVSPTAGKTLLAFGDSLMQYAGGSGSNDYGFFTQANKYLNMDMHNLGYAGSNWTGTGVGDCKARINKLISDGIAYDVILLGWGTNNDANLGTVDDTPSDSGSMCAVIKWAVQQIRTNFPHSGLGIILPPPGVSGGNEEKVNLIKSCCEHSSMHVPYLDLFHSANITTTPIGTGGLGDDQVHLGEHGRNRYASALKPFIEKLVPYIKNYLFTYNLTNVTASKTYKRMSEGTNITINLTAEEGHTLDNNSVRVTMGGVDVTSKVYNNNGKITIVVTGDIIITASAS